MAARLRVVWKGNPSAGSDWSESDSLAGMPGSDWLESEQLGSERLGAMLGSDWWMGGFPPPQVGSDWPGGAGIGR